MKNRISIFTRNQHGATALESAILIGGLAIVALIGIRSLGDEASSIRAQIEGVFNTGPGVLIVRDEEEGSGGN